MKLELRNYIKKEHKIDTYVSAEFVRRIVTSFPLFAEIIYFVVILVKLIEKFGYLLHLIAVDTFEIIGRISHCNDIWLDVRQVKVKAIIYESFFVARHSRA